MRSSSLRLGLAVLVAVSATQCLGQQAFIEGQTVEVREGDTWSAATVIKREGRRYQIRYEGSPDEEWVTTDRLRVSGGGAAGGAAVAPAGVGGAGAGGAEAGEGAGQWATNQEIEVKRGAAWRPAKYEKSENGWALVLYTQGNYKEWVEPWRIRALGSKEDVVGNAPMNREVKGDEAAPSTPPAPSPGGVAGWREPAVGDRVMYLDGWNIATGRVLAKRGGQTQVQLDNDRASKWVDDLDVRMSGLRLEAKVGQRVQIREPGGWKAGTVMAREPDRVRVMIDGWDHEMHHKWKGVDEIRPALAGDVPPLAGGRTARGPSRGPSRGPGMESPAVQPQMQQLPGYKLANRDGAQRLTLLLSPTARYTPDAAAGEAAPVQVVGLRVGEGAGQTMIVGSRDGSFVVASGAQARAGAMVAVDRVDVKSGRILNSVQLEVAKTLRILDLSPDGTRVVMAEPNGDRVEIWSLAGATPQRVLLMHPYADGDAIGKQVRHAAFVTDDRLMTISGKGELCLWDTGTGRALYTCGVQADSTPALSAGGRYLAFSTGKEAMIIDAATGAATMELPASLAGAKSFAFSPDGQQLVACTSSVIYAVDLTTGELTHDFSYLSGSGAFTSIGSPRKGYALINGSTLVELRLYGPVWKYNIPSSQNAKVLPNGQLAFTHTQGGGSQLAVVSIPHASAMKKIESLGARETLLAPGAKLSLSLNLSDAGAERARIEGTVRAALREHKFEVEEGQPLRLILSIERGKPIERTYSGFGAFRPAEKVTLAPWITTMRLDHNGQKVWEVRSQSGGPGHVLMKKERQSAQQAAEEQNKPNLNLFYSATIPAYLPRPENPMHAGESEFTGRGFLDKPASPEPERAPEAPESPDGPPWQHETSGPLAKGAGDARHPG